MRFIFSADGCSKPDEWCRANIGQILQRLGNQVTYWDWRQIPLTSRYTALTCLPPSVIWHVLVSDEIPPGFCDKARAAGHFTVLQGCDDDWRFNVTLQAAPQFDLVVTNDPDAVNLYRSAGINHVKHMQYGYDAHLFYPRSDIRQDLDVMFIGQAYAGRPELIQSLRERNIKVRLWGDGWPNENHAERKVLPELMARAKILLGLNWCANGAQPPIPQIKARIFEAAGNATFQLNYRDRRLHRYFEPDELVTWETPAELAALITYYLKHDEERQKIADRAHDRAIMEHRWESRLASVLERICLPLVSR